MQAAQDLHPPKLALRGVGDGKGLRTWPGLGAESGEGRGIS